jgi:sporulation protein YlmC with PRC-barrel domain
MISRAAIALVAVPALLAATAFAQTVGYVEVDDDAFIVDLFGLTVDDIDDMDIYGPGGDQVGEVEKVLVDASGEVVGFAVETEGFLGIGDEDVIVGVDQLELVGDRFVTSLTEEQLEELPRWEN